MTIRCKKCKARKHRVHFYDSDIVRETNICRACRKGYRPRGKSDNSAWRNSNHAFFAESGAGRSHA